MSIYLKLVFIDKIGLSERFNFAVHQIHITRLHHTEKHVKILFYTFPIHFDFVFNITFSFWKIVTLWIYGFNINVVQLDETIYLIFILGVVKKVSSTFPSAIQLKIISNNWLQIRTKGFRLPPGRLRKVKKFNYK